MTERELASDDVKITTRRLLEIVLAKPIPSDEECYELGGSLYYNAPKDVKRCRREAARVLANRIADKLGEP